MKKINIKLQNCYGIKKLEKELDFTDNRTIAIYAPNGFMKTSFAKTFKDLSKGIDSSDLMFPDRKTVREIKDENNGEIISDQVFVVESYSEDFKSEKISTLLVNKELKAKYDDIHIKIDAEKDVLLKAVSDTAKIRNGAEQEISQTFTNTDNQFFLAIGRVVNEVLDSTEPEYADISYKDVFNEKVVSFLETKGVKEKITDYINEYTELIEKSKYFKKGVFNHNNASVIAKSLIDNGFFQANHSVSLNAKEGKKEVCATVEELENVIEQEKNSILNNPDLVKAFEEIDKKLTKNKELRDFRDYLRDNLRILPELNNMGSFRMKLWVSYLKAHKDLFKSLFDEYQIGKEKLETIIKKAKEEQTRWIEVINIFNKRFSVPFQVAVKNQDDVILKSEIPTITFVFKDSDGEVPVEKTDLLKALSSGEKRALYLLNIIFEIEARKEDRQETLIIVDDIADSFDYKNKYAIIQYLKDISEEDIFYQIILTHNFDFFRIIESRKVVKYSSCFFAYKADNEVRLDKATGGIKNPFINDWKSDLTSPKKLIASIPFVRNIIEYTSGDTNENYIKLTSLLHWKADSENFKIADLKTIFEAVITDISFPNNDLTEKVVDKIFQEADACSSACEGINLENKIVLSIAIRLKAEKFMAEKINDPAFVSGISANQTIMLFKKFKEKYPLEIQSIAILEEVNLMTPENIHLNSFMYEPILDMCDRHLVGLYSELKALN